MLLNKNMIVGSRIKSQIAGSFFISWSFTTVKNMFDLWIKKHRCFAKNYFYYSENMDVPYPDLKNSNFTPPKKKIL